MPFPSVMDRGSFFPFRKHLCCALWVSPLRAASLSFCDTPPRWILIRTREVAFPSWESAQNGAQRWMGKTVVISLYCCSPADPLLQKKKRKKKRLLRDLAWELTPHLTDVLPPLCWYLPVWKAPAVVIGPVDLFHRTYITNIGIWNSNWKMIQMPRWTLLLLESCPIDWPSRQSYRDAIPTGKKRK